MKLQKLTPLLACLLLLSACSNAADPKETDTPASDNRGTSTSAPVSPGLEAQGLADLDVHQLIDTLDALPVAERSSDYMASIRPNELLVTDAEGTERSLPIEGDEFYLSFAPFVDKTHECYYHSLTTCKGELSKTPIHVLIVDTAGKTVVDEDVTTFDNGFYGVWLPRDLKGTLTVTTEDGLTGSVGVSTAKEDDKTCETTLQLS